MARTGSCHFESVSRQADTVSYGEWQEPVLAIREMARTISCHMVMVMVMAMVMVMVIVLVMTMVKEWQEL